MEDLTRRKFLLGLNRPETVVPATTFAGLKLLGLVPASIVALVASALVLGTLAKRSTT